VSEIKAICRAANIRSKHTGGRPRFTTKADKKRKEREAQRAAMTPAQRVSQNARISYELDPAVRQFRCTYGQCQWRGTIQTLAEFYDYYEAEHGHDRP
jgi:hypothetical protein